MAIMDRLKRVVNAFVTDEQEPPPNFGSLGVSTSSRPDRVRFAFTNERSIITSIYVRIAIDAASVAMKHVRLDDKDRYLQDMDSALNDCLTLEANIDQAARHFRQDIFMSLCGDGVIAIVPVDTTLNPKVSGSYDILTMRVGRIVQWYPQHVRVSVYNEAKGQRQEITLPKRVVAIVENPLYAVMNEPNSTLQRLVHKLNLLDAVDEQSASGKLDMIIQLPYVIKSEARRQQAEKRREDIEFQLKGSKYGIAYTDGTEKITQLNRPAENNLMDQIEYLTTMLYGQLGITPEVMNGTADEATTLNYWNRTIEPLLDAVVEAMRRNFLTKTGRSQKQSIEYFKDPFKLVPLSTIADIGDKFTQAEIMSSNEMRQVIGLQPSSDPRADQLVNSNINPMGNTPPTGQSTDNSGYTTSDTTDTSAPSPDTSVMAQSFDDIDSAIDQAFSGLGLEEPTNAS